MMFDLLTHDKGGGVIGLGFAAFLCFAIALKSCVGSFCDTTECKFEEGAQVKILNKLMHDNATVSDVHCGCDYTISYYTYMGLRRQRIVTEGEIK